MAPYEPARVDPSSQDSTPDRSHEIYTPTTSMSVANNGANVPGSDPAQVHMLPNAQPAPRLSLSNYGYKVERMESGLRNIGISIPHNPARSVPFSHLGAPVPARPRVSVPIGAMLGPCPYYPSQFAPPPTASPVPSFVAPPAAGTSTQFNPYAAQELYMANLLADSRSPYRAAANPSETGMKRLNHLLNIDSDLTSVHLRSPEFYIKKYQELADQQKSEEIQKGEEEDSIMYKGEKYVKESAVELKEQREESVAFADFEGAHYSGDTWQGAEEYTGSSDGDDGSNNGGFDENTPKGESGRSTATNGANQWDQKSDVSHQWDTNNDEYEAEIGGIDNPFTVPGFSNEELVRVLTTTDHKAYYEHKILKSAIDHLSSVRDLSSNWLDCGPEDNRYVILVIKNEEFRELVNVVYAGWPHRCDSSYLSSRSAQQLDALYRAAVAIAFGGLAGVVLRILKAEHPSHAIFGLARKVYAAGKVTDKFRTFTKDCINLLLDERIMDNQEEYGVSMTQVIKNTLLDPDFAPALQHDILDVLIARDLAKIELKDTKSNTAGATYSWPGPVLEFEPESAPHHEPKQDCTLTW